jgi:integrase
MPMYWPTLWTLTDLMASGKSINTIKQAMTTLKLVYAYLEEQGIQLEERLRSARFLERHELEGMYRYLKIPIRKVTNGKVVNISRFDEVSSGSFAIRLNYAKAFFVFVLEVYTFKHLHDEKKKKQMETVLHLVKAFFKARRPSIDKLTEPRMGLNKKDQEKLLSLIAVDGPKNPWKSEFVKVRNEAMIHLLLDSGMRRGELLTLKRSDLDIEQQTIKIEKKVEGLVDPRRYKPKVKTKSRLIPIKNSSINKVYEFIIKYRSKGPIGKKHP